MTYDREEIEAMAKDLACTIKECIPPEMGFALLMFDHGPSGSMAFISDSTVDSMIGVLQELLARLEAEGSSDEWPLRN